MKQIKPDYQTTLLKLSALLPIAVCFGVCSPLGLVPALICIAPIMLFAKIKTPVPCIEISLILVALLTLLQSNLLTTALTLVLTAIAVAVYKKPVLPGKAQRTALKIITAMAATAMFTNDYFGIGAKGTNPVSMVVNYISMGFHPNWRGILYGTIAMVIMITMRRKFKKTGLFFNFSLVAIIFNLILNYCLIPDFSASPIALVSKTDYFGNLGRISSFDKDAVSVVKSIVFAVILAAVISFALVSIKSRLAADSDGNAKSLCRLIYDRSSIVSGITALIISALLFALTKGFNGLPVSVCGVVLIVTAWQSK